MLHQNIVVRILAIFLITIVLFTGATSVLSDNAKAWEANVYVSPTTVSAGSNVSFEIMIENTGSESMEITWIGIHFDWMDEGYYYVSEDVSEDNPYILGDGDSGRFYIKVSIPAGVTTNIHYYFILRIYAADPKSESEWGTPYYTDYMGSVFVKEPEPTYKVYGYVYDTATGGPIEGATVTLGSHTTFTDDDGYYSIDGIKEGTYTIAVKAVGYQTSSKTVTVNGDMEIDFNLSPISTGGGGGVSNPRSGESGDWLLLIGALIIIAIIIIVVVIVVVASKRRSVAQLPPPPPIIPPTSEMQQKTEIGGNTKFCPYCGREIPADAKICPYCGHTLE